MRLAVFVDGENIAADHACAIWALALCLAQPILSRVYGDACKLVKWHEQAHFNLIHAGTGKNATDLLLCIDALDFALTGGCDTILLASSDRDFSHLALRLREKGLRVIGVGEAKTGPRFRAAVSAFHTLPPRPVAQLVPIAAPQPALTLVPKPKPPQRTKLDTKISDIVAAASQGGTSMDLALLGSQLGKNHKALSPMRLEKTWRSYFQARPDLYALDPKGPTAKVRILTKPTKAANG